ncbi:hypothetical protein, partial [Sphingobium yanoikuyae]|uniref:hypothetical protein n=1 Tax=Sphingobium yanoikuyae TaxID=13690 RepID=UPI0035C6E92D
GHGRPCHTHNRGGSAATDYTQGRLKMQPDGQHRNYTTLTDVTFHKHLTGGESCPFCCAQAV